MCTFFAHPLGLKISKFGSLLHTFHLDVFIFLGYNLLRTIYDDNFEPDVEVQIDGNMFQGMRGRVMFSKVSRADRVREGRGGAVGWLLPPPAFCRFGNTALNLKRFMQRGHFESQRF